jgi:penicillin amidase
MKRTSLYVFLTVLLVATGTTAATAKPAADGAAGNGSVTIIRDDYGVPHVYGSTLESVYYGIGYAQGQDRLWQADVHRRLGTGTLAEFFGPSSVGGDIQSRTLFGPPERRAELLAGASAEFQASLQAFADGMNRWIDEATASGQLPVEYGAFGLTPRAWTVDDSIATFMLLGSQFGWFGSSELDNAAELGQLIALHGPADGAAMFADMHWLDDPDAPTTAPGDGAMGPVRRGAGPHADLPRGVAKAAAGFAADRAAFEHNLNLAGIEPGPASNAIVLAPKLTTDGHALLLGGPQMGYGTPQINHEIGIHGAGFDVTGMEIAGWPGTPIGVGNEYAWTLTSGFTDNNDIYVEVLNDAGQYLFDGEWHDFDCRTETIGVAGAPSVDTEVCESIHGPVLGTAPGAAFTFKTITRGEELNSLEEWTNLARAKSIDDFAESLSKISYNFNVLYADARGNIAYWHIGFIPIRADGDDPLLPHDGTGGAEWQGIIPWDEMPHALNPERGWMTSWNNKPQVGWENTEAGFGTYGPVHRVNTLINMLEQIEPGTANMETLEAINRAAGWTTDTPSGSASTVFVSTLLDDLLAHVDGGADARLPAIAAMLEGWDWLQVDADGDDAYDHPSVAVFNTWWEALVARVLSDELGPGLDGNVASNIVARLLDADPGVPLLHDYLDGESAGQAVTGALVDALDSLAVTYGSADVADWLAPVAKIHWSPLGAGAVPDTIWMNRGTYNQIVHLGKGPHLYGENVVSPGQSGDPFSPHFADQLALYATWAYKPMVLDRQDLKGHTESVTKLHLP